MTASRPHRPSRPELAEVIPLVRPGATPRDPADAGDSVAQHVEVLERRCGDRWSELPSDLGRRAAVVEGLVQRGPTRLDTTKVAPGDAVHRSQLLVRAALTVADQLVEEAEVLGEALGARLADLPLRSLDHVVAAVLELATLARAEASWARPSAATAAEVVVDAHAAELRAIARGHHDLYARFTDRVLEIPESRLRAGRRPWRVIARAHLRRNLAAASRTGRAPGGIRSLANEILTVHDARRRLLTLAPLLATHLGHRGWSPLMDVDALAGSLAGVRRLQRALGDRLDEDRLAGLLAAEAFQSPELVIPATNLRSLLQGWRIDVSSLCGGDPWATPADQLAPWAVQTAAALPAVSAGLKAMARIDRRPPTLHDLVDDLLVRQRVAELDTDHRFTGSGTGT